MSRIGTGVWSMVVALVLLLSIAAHAADSDGVFTGAGRVVIKRQPQVLRAQFVVVGEAKDVAGAIAKLKEAQAGASKKLAELGAAEKSIEFGPTQMGAGAATARDQYTQYMQDMQRMGQPGRANAPAKPQTVTVSSTLKAEWALASGGADELFIAGVALQEKIKAAGIGKKDLKKLTPEEQEAAEEAAGMKPPGAGEPGILFVCKISEADRAAALAEGFQKAKQDAAELAKAAGAELGALRHIEKGFASPTATVDPDQIFKQMLAQQNGTAMQTTNDVPSDEATSPNPTSVGLEVNVTASFATK